MYKTTADDIARISEMEQNLDLAQKAISDLDEALNRYIMAKENLAKLEAYYNSPKWLRDYEADEKGAFPKDLKRGVLSQDAVYNLLADHYRVLSIMKELSK